MILYVNEGCGFRVHDKCVSEIRRDCAAERASRIDFILETNICPERGLAAQNYRCAECQTGLNHEMDTRQCDFNGQWYCTRCHWNDELMIPARLIHNWDGEKRKVCRASKQLLTVLDKRPLINLAQLNPALFKFDRQLEDLQRIRRYLLLMKCYFVSCKTARKLRILQYLNRHQHFVESSEIYSIADLREILQGRLLIELEMIYAVFERHITVDCEICRGNGFICELCDSAQLLFPFSRSVSLCRSCCAVFHSSCYSQQSGRCPRCKRRQQRKSIDAVVL